MHHADAAGSRIAPLANRAQLRPLVYIASIAVVCVLEHAVLWLAKGLPHRSALLRIVPLAGLNSCVLGTVLVERTQSFTLGQSLGFGLGSGLGPSRWCISACWHWQSMVSPDIL